MKTLDTNVIQKLDKRFGSGFVNTVIDYLTTNVNQTQLPLLQEQIDEAQDWWED